jgi:DNA invertase Pin-like site-specific DNA recombinase
LQDIGVSAFDGSNVLSGQLGLFLKAVNEGRIAKGSFLLVESLDRLSREDALSALGTFTSLLKAGITIVTLSDNK